MPARKQTKVIKKVLPKAPVKKLAKVGGLTTWVTEGSDEEVDVVGEVLEAQAEVVESKDTFIPHDDSGTPDQVMERMAAEHAQLIGSLLLKMEAEPQNFYNIRMKVGRCIIERMGVSPALVMEDNLHDALVAMDKAE